jgi:YesN/AraC family two-component response regulator
MTQILLIEDEESCREIAQITLNGMGISDIIFANDGAHALKLMDRMEAPPDVVISDVFMPNMDGIEFVGALAKRKFLGGLILLTGIDPEMLRIANTIAVTEGLNVMAALLKPLNKPALVNAFKAFHYH